MHAHLIAIFAALAITATTVQDQLLTAAPLNGFYAGEATGQDASGQQVHELSKWRFTNNVLTFFAEVGTFAQSTGYTACAFSPETAGPYPVRFFDQGPNDNFFISMVSYGCPGPSTNRRPEALEIIPDSRGAAFSFIEHTSSFAVVVDPDLPAQLSGHAQHQ